MVQHYLVVASNHGAVRAVAISTSRSLILDYRNLVAEFTFSDHIECKVYSIGWCLLKGFINKAQNTGRYFTTLQFNHDIASKVDKFHIPKSLIMNIDQTSNIPVVRSSLA